MITLEDALDIGVIVLLIGVTVFFVSIT